ncbi:hypothetical protein [Arthrobacter sp. BL-252-APC-1A]|uniref:hypothetical protein n=1 Tax=Arthrobacter sp. BL-252-APC-1A TaxID=2606622 RepID=UPI002DD7C542|nr:hypothetical protein [Arthrobacter sp. BL-252-APC-1A]
MVIAPALIIGFRGRPVSSSSEISLLAAIKEIFIDAFTPEQLANLENAAAALRTHLGMPAR